MRLVLLVLACSVVMALGTLGLMLLIPRFLATIVGSIITSLILIRASLSSGTSFGELLSAGTATAVLGSFLLNTAYYAVWGYVRELHGIREAIETFIMLIRSGVFIYMYVVDLFLSFTSILAVASIVAMIFIGE